jgi:hypothetical protein
LEIRDTAFDPPVPDQLHNGYEEDGNPFASGAKNTAFDSPVSDEHGTYSMRNKWGCDCEECKEYVRRSKRESRERIRLRILGCEEDG